MASHENQESRQPKILRENMLGYLSADISSSKKQTVCELGGTESVQGQISEHIFAPNGGYYVYYPNHSRYSQVLAAAYSVT